MDLLRQEYPSLLTSVSPANAVSIFSERMKNIGKLNSEIADWLQERRRVEEAYHQGLRKLGRKQISDTASELGILNFPWQKILKSAETLAESHYALAQKIENDVERPLREFTSTDSEYQAMTIIHGNLTTMAKEVEAANRKAVRLREKGTKAAAGKVASATAEVDSANNQWESQAPFIFEKLQAVDESRIDHLRDILTQLQTHELDQIERTRSAAEKCLNALLNVNTREEILTFVNKYRKDQYINERQPAEPTSSPAVANRIPTTSDGKELVNKLVPTSETKPGSLSGLKRLSTVLGRRRQIMHPYGQSSSSPDRKSSSNLTPSLPSLSRKASRQNNIANSSELPSNSSSRQNLYSENDQTNADPAPRNATSSTAQSQRDQKQVGNGKSDLLVPQKSAPYQVNGMAMKNIREIPEPQLMESKVTTSAPAPINEINKDGNLGSQHAGVDLIAKAQEEAAKVSNISSPQFKVDIRQAPIAETGAEADAALASVASTLRAQAAITRKPGTVRGRRDVRNTMFISSPQSVDARTSSDHFSNTASSVSSSLANSKVDYKSMQAEDYTLSDTHSFQSSYSLGSSTSVAMKHPELEDLGLNASMMETVSAWTHGGKLIKAAVVGEIALAYNHSGTSLPYGTATIRMDNFPLLEKVATNPAFVKQVPERLGEYVVETAAIHKTSVAFKYQVHLEENSGARHIPLVLAPVWKFEPSQASVILSYHLNPAISLDAGTSITLKNLAIIIHLEGAKATSCQSKPVGTFSRERSAVYWRLGEAMLKSGQEAVQLRARFYTESEGKAGKAEARWEVNNEDAMKVGSGLRLSQIMQTAAVITPRSDTGADPFADEGISSSSPSWKDVSVARKVISGTFVAS